MVHFSLSVSKLTGERKGTVLFYALSRAVPDSNDSGAFFLLAVKLHYVGARPLNWVLAV